MHSSASRRTDRAAAATGALLLQLGFIAAFVHGFSAQAPSRQLQHELTFSLPRLPRPEPVPSRQAPRTAAPVLAPYDVTTYGAGNFYKREQDYEAWHKDHPTAPASAKAAGNHPQ